MSGLISTTLPSKEKRSLLTRLLLWCSGFNKGCLAGSCADATWAEAIWDAAAVAGAEAAVSFGMPGLFLEGAFFVIGLLVASAVAAGGAETWVLCLAAARLAKKDWRPGDSLDSTSCCASASCGTDKFGLKDPPQIHLQSSYTQI